MGRVLLVVLLVGVLGAGGYVGYQKWQEKQAETSPETPETPEVEAPVTPLAPVEQPKQEEKAPVEKPPEVVYTPVQKVLSAAPAGRLSLSYDERKDLKSHAADLEGFDPKTKDDTPDLAQLKIKAKESLKKRIAEWEREDLELKLKNEDYLKVANDWLKENVEKPKVKVEITGTVFGEPSEGIYFVYQEVNVPGGKAAVVIRVTTPVGQRAATSDLLNKTVTVRGITKRVEIHDSSGVPYGKSGGSMYTGKFNLELSLKKDLKTAATLRKTQLETQLKKLDKLWGYYIFELSAPVVDLSAAGKH